MQINNLGGVPPHDSSSGQGVSSVSHQAALTAATAAAATDKALEPKVDIASKIAARREDYGVTLGASLFYELASDRNIPLIGRGGFAILCAVSSILCAPDAGIKALFGADSKVRWANPLFYLGLALGALATKVSVSERATVEERLRVKVDALRAEIDAGMVTEGGTHAEDYHVYRGEKPKETIKGEMQDLLVSAEKLNPAVANRGWFQSLQSQVTEISTEPKKHR